MILQRYYESIEVIKKEKLLAVRLLQPHRVLSTCRVGRGFSEDCEYVVNHQACEPAGHLDTDLHEIAIRTPEKYLARIAERHGLPPGKTVMMTTAANMNNVGFSVQRFEDLEVVAMVTGGVEGNAACAGDVASYMQRAGGSERVESKPGTIVTLAFTNWEMSHSAMLIASTVMTEAKVAVVRDYYVKSRQSDRLATGTGTDQFTIASKLGSDYVLTDANKHSKVGELFGKAVDEATRKALNLQNGLSPDTRRSCLVFLNRLGCDADKMKALVKAHLDEPRQQLFEKNFLAVNHDSMIVAAVAGFVQTWELLSTGVLPADHRVELLTRDAASVAAAVAGRVAFEENVHDLLALDGFQSEGDAGQFVCRAIAYGFEEKWKGLFGTQ